MKPQVSFLLTEEQTQKMQPLYPADEDVKFCIAGQPFWKHGTRLEVQFTAITGWRAWLLALIMAPRELLKRIFRKWIYSW